MSPIKGYGQIELTSRYKFVSKIWLSLHTQTFFKQAEGGETQSVWDKRPFNTILQLSELGTHRQYSLSVTHTHM